MHRTAQVRAARAERGGGEREGEARGTAAARDATMTEEKKMDRRLKNSRRRKAATWGPAGVAFSKMRRPRIHTPRPLALVERCRNMPLRAADRAQSPQTCGLPRRPDPEIWPWDNSDAKKNTSHLPQLRELSLHHPAPRAAFTSAPCSINSLATSRVAVLQCHMQ